MLLKRASIYERDEIFFISPSNRTKAGFWIDGDHVALASPSMQEIETAVKNALSLSRSDVRTPSPEEQGPDDLLRSAGVRSWSSFAKRAVYLGVEQQEGRLTVTPHQNGGAREGYLPLNERAVHLSEGEDGLGALIDILVKELGQKSRS